MSRVRVQRREDHVAFTIGAASRNVGEWVVVVVLAVVAGAMAINLSASRGNTLGAACAVVILCILLAIIAAVLWGLLSHEELVADGETQTLAFCRKLGPLRSSKRFPATDATNFRSHVITKQTRQGSTSWRVVSFDVKGETFDIARNLPEAEAKSLARDLEAAVADAARARPGGYRSTMVR